MIYLSLQHPYNTLQHLDLPVPTTGAVQQGQRGEGMG